MPHRFDLENLVEQFTFRGSGETFQKTTPPTGTPRESPLPWLHYLIMCGRYTLTTPSDLATRFGLGVIWSQ